jgi:Domain of unknown function (DUF4920)
MGKFGCVAYVSALLLVSACGQKQERQEVAQDAVEVAAPAPLSKAEIGSRYLVQGDTISPESITTLDSVESSLVTGSGGNFTVKGKVGSVCQVKGCWMEVKMPSGKNMHIDFKDYAFFMPKDIVGKEVIFQGVASNDTMSVEERRHYAEDAGKSEAEIAKITEPELKYQFTATGVLIPKTTEKPIQSL